ncbi:TetR/AcrR family transcriptional regulator [Paenibacillus sp. N1-5-1-14]|uniref:TetR/AcrR family transcriptional regulator n=1 Tax=Paenibacillus radicibacter TaxID=2972488 RepID=UPI0021595BD6|nr:TetR/AcrR family transcriptional regulator [Paenibacillus radicibacter]MCR8643770.1 TetR/AcrR family transcriptional regulator [Paenibacillus radicibacter]
MHSLVCKKEVSIISDKICKRDQLLTAVIDLVAEKGYNGVSTKEIAATAGVNEVTLFRQFGNKQNLLETAFHHFHYADEMTKLFQDKITGDLHTDLLLISRSYQEIMYRNRKVMQIALKEHHIFAGFQEKANKHPKKLLELLTQYFDKMLNQGKLIETNTNTQALSFMWMNYGAFISNMYESESSFPSTTMEQFILESAVTFTRALTP